MQLEPDSLLALLDVVDALEKIDRALELSDHHDGNLVDGEQLPLNPDNLPHHLLRGPPQLVELQLRQQPADIPPHGTAGQMKHPAGLHVHDGDHTAGVHVDDGVPGVVHQHLVLLQLNLVFLALFPLLLLYVQELQRRVQGDAHRLVGIFHHRVGDALPLGLVGQGRAAAHKAGGVAVQGHFHALFVLRGVLVPQNHGVLNAQIAAQLLQLIDKAHILHDHRLALVPL